MDLNELHKNTSGMDRKEPGEWIAIEESSTKTRANAMHRVALYYKRPNNAGGGVIGDLWGQGMEANAAFIVAAHREVPKLLEEIARLREALEWYADGENYFEGSPGYADSDYSDSFRWELDEGERARKALGQEGAK